MLDIEQFFLHECFIYTKNGFHSNDCASRRKVIVLKSSSVNLKSLTLAFHANVLTEVDNHSSAPPPGVPLDCI